MKLKDIKLEYIREELKTSDLSLTPHEQFHIWMDEAIKAEVSYPNAASLSTVSKDYIPSSRTILIKDYNENGVTFFSDYTSHKAMEINENPNASLLLFWKEFDRQIRITGTINKCDPLISESYWNSRPKESQISALASNQSSEISKEELERRVSEMTIEFKDQYIERPITWGGYQLSFDKVEFWQGRPNRLHDRFLYESKNDSWEIKRLSP